MTITYQQVYMQKYASQDKEARIFGRTLKRLKAPKAKGQIWRKIKAGITNKQMKGDFHPFKATAEAAGTATGLVWPGMMIYDMVANKEDPSMWEQGMDALKDPASVSRQTRNNFAVAGTAGLTGAASIYGLLGAVPGLQKRRLLRAATAALGGAGLGYLGWQAANNYQNSSPTV